MPLRLPNNPAPRFAPQMANASGVHPTGSDASLQVLCDSKGSSLVLLGVEGGKSQDAIGQRRTGAGMRRPANQFQRHADDLQVTRLARQLHAGWVSMHPASFIPPLLTEAAAHAVASLFWLTTLYPWKFLFRLANRTDTHNAAVLLC